MTSPFAEIAAEPAVALERFDTPRAGLLPAYSDHQNRIRGYKEVCRQFSETLSSSFAQGGAPVTLTRTRTRFVDRILVNAWNDLGAEHGHASQAALLAVGGYGRG